MKQPLISIIVPVYNVETSLLRCLDSISTQSYSYFEALLIDDGSTDRSGSICDEYALKDSRFHVFHKENGGVSSARNLGLRHIKGVWFSFVDADDIIYKDALLHYISHISEDVDIVSGYYNILDANGEGAPRDIKKKISKRITFEDALKHMFAPFDGIYNGYLWTRLFRTSVLREFNLSFNEKIHIKEDSLFIVEYICHSRKDVFFTSELVYGYIQSESSVMKSLKKKFNPKYLTDIDACVLMNKAIREVSSDPKLLRYSRDYLYYIHLKVKNHIKKNNPFKIKAWWQLYSKTLKGMSFGTLMNYYNKSFKSKLSKGKK